MHKSLIILVLLAGLVSAQSLTADTPLQTVCLGDEYEVIAIVDFGDVTERCTGCTCTARVEDMTGNVLETTRLIEKGGGYYKANTYSPPFEENHYYDVYMSCVDGEGTASYGVSRVGIKDHRYCSAYFSETEDEESFFSPITDYLPDMGGYIPELPFGEYFGWASDFIDAGKSFVDTAVGLFSSLKSIGETVGEIMSYPGSVAGWIGGKGLPYLYGQAWEFIYVFYKPFILMELLIIVYALGTGRDIIMSARLFFKYNQELFLFLASILGPLIGLAVAVFEGIVSLINSARNMLPI